MRRRWGPTVSKIDVIVVGSGPVGQLTALLLAERGRSVTVIEPHERPFPLPRAVGLAGESLRILQQLGFSKDFDVLLELLPRGQEFILYLDGRGEILLKQPLPFTDGDMGWPAMASFAQPTLEEHLERRLVDHPSVDLRRGFQAVGLEQGLESVTVEVACCDPTADRAEGTLTGSLVIGCDGANSFVRGQTDILVHDLGFSFDWLVVDVQPHSQVVFEPYIAQLVDPSRPTTVAPGGPPGRRRFEFMCLPTDAMDEMNTPETAWRLLERWGMTPATADLLRHSVYRFRGAWAEKWREGRVLLAGDAAHLMPPFLAQGINSGFRDAASLAWRIDLLLSGLAPIQILDTYGSERAEHVQTIIEASVGIGQMICITDPDEAEERDDFMRMANADPNLAPPPPPRWRLGPGIFDVTDPEAGFLGVQGMVESGGRIQLLEDAIGGGRFVLFGADADPVASLSNVAADFWAKLGGSSVWFGPSSDVIDVNGTYAAWFEDLSARVVLVRPDFYVFGTGASVEEADRLVLHLKCQCSAGS
jgi:2-polyprenyl-6-methoxyphenol hydroxylase-like FAD-dependent oxidoreductase